MRVMCVVELHVVGSKVESWANQALDYAINYGSSYVATAYLKPAPEDIYDPRSRWVVYEMRSRQSLDDWYKSLVGATDRYHYIAVFDKTTTEWRQGRPVASAVADPDAYVGATPSARAQLKHLDRLVAAHETYWAAIAQHNPRSDLMREFLQLHWDPWYSTWIEARSALDRQQTYVDAFGTAHPQTTAASDGDVAHFVSEAARALAGLRELAAYNGIPTPDLGTHDNFQRDETPRVTRDEGERTMSAHAYAGWDTYAGADGSYPQTASRAVASVQQQNPSPIYGYLREGSQQKIYLFPALDQARAWFADLVQAPSHDYAAVFAAPDVRRPVPGLESFGQPAISGAYVGADGSSYPDVAAHAVAAARQQNPSAAYGYLREGLRQRIYLFHALDQAHAWYTALVQAQTEPYDYAAVFAEPDLSRPVPGLESFGQTTVSGEQIGSVLPFLLGLPLGALGGYAYRGWRDQHPGKWLPWLSGDPNVGGPWLDVEPIVGADLRKHAATS